MVLALMLVLDSYYVQAVTQWHDYGFGTRVGSDLVVECGNAKGLLVLWERILAYLAIP